MTKNYSIISLILFALYGNGLTLSAQDFFLSSVARKEIVSIAPLSNPDRGFHLESIYQVMDEAGKILNPYGRGAGQGQTGDEAYPDGFMDTRNVDFQSQGDSVTLTQLYIYLTSFWDTPLSQTGLDNIQTLFDGLRSHQVKAILRFAYSRDDGRIGNGHSGQNPGYAHTLSHLAQLKPLIQDNMDVISVVEAGFIGTWGEWTPGYSAAENRNIAKTLFDCFPESQGMLVRYNSIKDNLAAVLNTGQLARVGFANDYFTTGLKNCGSSDYCMDSPEYNRVKDESFTFYMRGEIPYNEGPPWGFDVLMDPDTVLKVLKDHHYTALDITQNFADNIAYWKTCKIYPEKLQKNKIFFSEDYFKDEQGETLLRSLYQFIRDHLGYRLNLLNTSTLRLEDGNLQYNLELTNTGFAAPLHPKTVYLLLIDEAGQIAEEIELAGVNPNDWQPFAKGNPDEHLTHTIQGTLHPEVTGKYKVGIWVADNHPSNRNKAAFSIKFATESQTVTHWTDAAGTRTVNIIGEIEF
ncbi:MAG: DUF4874 domain-containing protein [Candidatus Symbiothrix sp.]|jgi:hypothetical protein|nr:DUF4874 domain-containing protein [Candidatus Symbiothrix sp.]